MRSAELETHSRVLGVRVECQLGASNYIHCYFVVRFFEAIKVLCPACIEHHQEAASPSRIVSYWPSDLHPFAAGHTQHPVEAFGPHHTPPAYTTW